MSGDSSFSVGQERPDAALLRFLLDWWWTRRGEAPYPPRGALDPLDLKPLLGRLVLIEVRDGGYFFRLYGSIVAAEFDFDLTGRWLDDMPDPGLRDMARQSYGQVVASGAPVLTRRNATVRHVQKRYESLLLPLGRDGGVTHILLGLVPVGPASADQAKMAGGNQGV